jgi:hypothetical protein
MKTLLLSLVAGLALVLTTSTAEAGGGNGGGTKPNATIKVKNKTDGRIYVIANEDPEVISDAQDLLTDGVTNSDLNKFKKLGGKVINAGATGVFSVRANDDEGVIVAALQVDTSSGNVEGQYSETVFISKGDVETITLDDEDFSL